MTSETEIIDEALTHQVLLNSEEIKSDIKTAKDREKINHNTLFIIRKYEKQNLNDKETRIIYNKDICLNLKDLKQDFIPLLQIYNILSDKQKSYKLKQYFRLQNNGESSNIEGEMDEYLEPLALVLNLCFLYDEEKYYSNFVKEILNLIDHFKVSYNPWCNITEYIDDKNGKNRYKTNNFAFRNCCIAIVKDINRIITEYELNKGKYIHDSTQTDEKESLDKISENKFKFLIRRAGLKYDDILLNIFNTSNNNDDILNKIKSLYKKDEEKYWELKDNLEEFLEINNIKKNIINWKQKINTMDKAIKSMNKKIININKVIKEQNGKIDSQEKSTQNQNITISDLKTKIDHLSNENINIKKRLNFLEIFFKASLSKEAINHCMNSIITKYKDSVIVEENKEDNSFNVIVTKDINGVSVKDSNDLISSLLEKKDPCNILTTAPNFLGLNEKEKESIDGIITKDLKDESAIF